MSRVINPDSVGKERTRLSKAIVLSIRELAKQTEPTPMARDLVAFIALALQAIAERLKKLGLDVPGKKTGAAGDSYLNVRSRDLQVVVEVNEVMRGTLLPVRSTGSNPIHPASPGSLAAASRVATPPAEVPINTRRDLSTGGNPSAPLSSAFASSTRAAPLRQ